MPTTMKEISERWLDPGFKFFVNRPGSLEAREKFLREGGRMKDEYLGACLDYIRGAIGPDDGPVPAVVYKHGSTGMIDFIQYWRDLNENNLLWSEQPLPKNFKLPHINYPSCPRDKEHKGTLRDLAGRIRCSYTTKKELKPSFIRSYRYPDGFSGMNEIGWCENKPHDPTPGCDETGKVIKGWEKEYAAHLRELKKFEHEEPTAVVHDTCYAIISDNTIILSLEEVLDRLKEINVFPTEKRDSLTVHTFSGWDLAWYVQKWWKQVPDGKAPIFEKDK